MRSTALSRILRSAGALALVALLVGCRGIPLGHGSADLFILNQTDRRLRLQVPWIEYELEPCTAYGMFAHGVPATNDGRYPIRVKAIDGTVLYTQTLQIEGPPQGDRSLTISIPPEGGDACPPPIQTHYVLSITNYTPLDLEVYYAGVYLGEIQAHSALRSAPIAGDWRTPGDVVVPDGQGGSRLLVGGDLFAGYYAEFPLGQVPEIRIGITGRGF
ncbi:MAG: hypothetical protein ACYC4R_02425 [Anaerolineae bacterium]